MNKPLMIVTALSVVVAGGYFLQEQELMQLQQSSQEVTSMGGATTPLTQRSALSVGNTASISDTGAGIVSQQQASVLDQQLEQQEAEIKGLISGYEQARHDPAQRAAHLQQMEQALAQYSADVLPVALAKMKAQDQ